MSRRARVLGVAALAGLTALTAAGCGRRGSPVAPERRAPQAVAVFSGEVRNGAIELSWTNPRRRVDNTPLRDLVQARVYRVEDAGTGEPRSALLVKDRIAGYTEVATVPLAGPEASTLVQGDRVRLSDRRDLVPGRRYTYVVVTEDTQGRVSPPSPRVSLSYIAAPAPPGGLAATPGDREVQLRWDPSTRLVDGTPPPGPLGYEVLRAPGPGEPLAPLARTAPGVTTLTDRGLENDRTYAYAVRGVRTEGTTTAVGETSGRVLATPRDTTPPAPPTNLVAIPSEGTVRLSWSASPDPDVAGYIIYRAPEGGAFARVGSVRSPTTVFVDREVPRGSQRYVVTAQDSAVQPNESAHSTEVRVTVP